MVDITIYQIDPKKGANLAFTSYNKHTQMTGGIIDASIYEKVYETTLPHCKTLETVFTIFNVSCPDDFRGHSLSVSDVVEISGCESVADGFYYCNSIGFVKIDFAAEKCAKSICNNKCEK